ncbi:MAG: nickel pincer cofactor biosynthesis protein LarB [Actinobacteria bacterium]|nr:nickel pincer cofactor biosynthesis protein LarB [Actinomycetota bacterium]
MRHSGRSLVSPTPSQRRTCSSPCVGCRRTGPRPPGYPALVANDHDCGTDESGDAGTGIADLGFARLDLDREARTGDPEVVFGAGKSVSQVLEIVAALRAAHPDRPALVTRAPAPMRAALEAAYGAAATVDGQARAVAVGALPEPAGVVCVLSAGTSDGPVAAEAAFTARVLGVRVERVSDVGVAGVHRLLAVRDLLDAADCLVVVAGMDGALPSVVGGLVGVPLVAVPTSVGYGASFGGVAALLTMLNSCAPGVVVSNIDNGFGAGMFAARVARRAAVPRAAVPRAAAPQAATRKGSGS